jgi:very-short-patch-repair endonuclease
MKHDFARRLRREQTSVERKLWFALRSRRLNGFKFRRQQPIGPYIVDFVSFEARLVIELDGDQHGSTAAVAYDAARTAALAKDGFPTGGEGNRL